MENWPSLLLLAASFLMLNADKRVLSCFSPFVFSLSHTSTLSHHTHTSKPLSFSLYTIVGPITSTHTGRILYFGRNWPKQPGTYQNLIRDGTGGLLFRFVCRYETELITMLFWAGLEKWTHWVAVELRRRLLFLCVCFRLGPLLPVLGFCLILFRLAA